MATADELIAQYIEENPRRQGPANARIMPYGVAVRAIVGYLGAVQGSAKRAAEDYDLPTDAVKAALAYYERHKQAIDARIAANAA
ncbi:MAG TPA: hypothetical protein VFZ25_07200 [Chloroflexota bacterium]|nr:hypothetical protein [Chloroflexota bacterium]